MGGTCLNGPSSRIGHVHASVLRTPGDAREHPGVADEWLSADDVRAIILALMRIEEKLDELLGEDDDDGEEEDLA
jgi:hypothetical protein